jgi:hypothetical protein
MSMSRSTQIWDDFFHTKRKFDDTKDKDKLSIPSDSLKQAFRKCQIKK